LGADHSCNNQPKHRIKTIMKYIPRLGLLGVVALSCAADPKTTKNFAEPSPPSLGSPRTEQPEELGIVPWRRDFEAAVQEAKAKNLPLLVLFDEVPGCSTVLGFGRDVLSHPLIADAIEAYFVPVAVYNNIPGPDQEILSSFREPSWNNPVVRIIDTQRQDLAPRYAGDYQVKSFAALLRSTIESTGRKVPAYLDGLASTQEETAIFSMYCFWSGEAALGKIDGVLRTRTGFLDGREVVEVVFDPGVVSYNSLVSIAKREKIVIMFYARSEAQLGAANKAGVQVALNSAPVRHSESDDKYQLRRTSWWQIPMSEWQATRANSLLSDGENPASVFSPRQQSLYQKLSSKQPATTHYIGDVLSGAYLSAEKQLIQ
jgi:hypothetical protein